MIILCRPWGELAAASYAIDQLVAENARQLDLGAEALLLEHEDTENIVLQGALATAKTQLVVSRLVSTPPSGCSRLVEPRPPHAN
jgi:hypothetical protein